MVHVKGYMGYVIRSPLQLLFSFRRRTKTIILIFSDWLTGFLSVLLAGVINLPSVLESFGLWVAVCLPLVGCLIFAFLSLYREVVRYFSGFALARAALVALLLAVTGAAIFNFGQEDFRGRFLMDLWFMLTISWLIPRIALKTLAELVISEEGESVFVYGAGNAGRALIKSLDAGSDFHAVGFIDEDLSKQESVISGRSVFSYENGVDHALELGVRKILIAIPALSQTRRKKLVLELVKRGFSVFTVPQFVGRTKSELADLGLKQLRVEDLLGRDPIQPMGKLLDEGCRGKRVLVTGAGGSIGSELCRQLLAYGANELVLVDSSEASLYSIEQELLDRRSEGVAVRPLLCDLANEQLVARCLKDLSVDIVYHAAAYKHVPLVEGNVVAGLVNNVLALVNMMRWADSASVGRFVLVSTDKAVRPTNVMGATKRLCELLTQGFESKVMSRTVVRFGNVLGSSGSVIPKFREQIAAGGPVTVTDERITRYFMTIPEAASLVIQAGVLGQHGEVFLLDMGDEVKILELAKTMISLAGFRPVLSGKGHDSSEVAIAVTGLRPGEKLSEELLVDHQSKQTVHPRIFEAADKRVPLAAEDVLAQLSCAADSGELAVREYLLALPLNYVQMEQVV